MTSAEFLDQLLVDNKALELAKDNLKRWHDVKRLVESNEVVNLVDKLTEDVNATTARIALGNQLLDAMEDPTERACLRFRYVFGYKIKAIAKRMAYGERSIHKYIASGKQHFEELYSKVSF